MASILQNLVGRRVFNNSSYAPNRGQVSASGAQGYLQRELAKQTTARTAGNQPYQGTSTWGQDGASDTRSGVAAGLMPTPRGPGIPTGVPDRAVSPNSASGVQAPNQGIPTGRVPTDIHVPGQFTTTPAPSTTPQKAVVQITDTGKLKLPFDFQSASAVLNAKQKADEELAQLTQERQAAALQYLQQKRQAEGEYGEAKLGALNDNASRGTAFSSGYGKAVSTNANKFNTLLQNLEAGEGQSKNDDTLNRRRILSAFKSYLKQTAIGQGYTLDQKAGTWNLKKKSTKKKKK